MKCRLKPQFRIFADNAGKRSLLDERLPLFVRDDPFVPLKEKPLLAVAAFKGFVAGGFFCFGKRRVRSVRKNHDHLETRFRHTKRRKMERRLKQLDGASFRHKNDFRIFVVEMIFLNLLKQAERERTIRDGTLNLFGNFSFRTGYFERRYLKLRYFSGFKLVDLSGNMVSEQVY